ncbi:Small heat shock protein HSP [Trema orientale]|uniref:Small heat shock protein HSP n=1 Tax=Trema orientale TaxID=63057 RepID=A0A2P5EQ35_TREOI|nr:Small heat shock protein HSP [Trema orientale]
MSMIPNPNFFGRRPNFDPFSHDVWDPFEGFPNWPTPSPFDPSPGFPVARTTQIDWRETPTGHVFKTDVPGLRKQELKVAVEEGRVLKISAEGKRAHEERTDAWHRVERSSGKFERRIRLPENAKVEQLTAALENGVLTVTVPKVVPRQTGVRSIEISG